MTNARSLAIACALLLTISGCGRGGAKVTQPAPEADSFNDWRYNQTIMSYSDTGFREFLKGLPPADRVKYINKSVEDNPPLSLYGLKGSYEQFVNDPNPDVASAAKEALSKVPTPEEYENLKKEAKEKLQAQFAK